MKPKTKGEILHLISSYQSDLEVFESHKSIATRSRNNIRLLQWVLGLRTRPYPEGEGLMQKEDAKALELENQMRKKLRMKSR